MKTIDEYIEKWYYKSTVLTRNIGNTGYFIRFGEFGDYKYNFIKKEELIYIISCFETNPRKVKLIALQILND